MEKDIILQSETIEEIQSFKDNFIQKKHHKSHLSTEVKINDDSMGIITNDPQLITIMIDVLKSYIRSYPLVVLPPESKLTLNYIAWLQQIPVQTVIEWVQSGELKCYEDESTIGKYVVAQDYKDFIAQQKEKRLNVLHQLFNSELNSCE